VVWKLQGGGFGHDWWCARNGRGKRLPSSRVITRAVSGAVCPALGTPRSRSCGCGTTTSDMQHGGSGHVSAAAALASRTLCAKLWCGISGRCHALDDDAQWHPVDRSQELRIRGIS
jgi:hypothetical protein